MSAATPVLAEPERRRIVIGVLLAMLLSALDQTIIAPAVPTIGAELGDISYLPWIVSAYFVTGTAVTPLYGKLADIHGRRPVLFVAIGIFVLGSILCALAPTMLSLVLARALQGVGGGGLIALAQTVIGDIVPPRERGRYIVYISGIWATASVAGPILGGFFAERLHWTLIFWLNLPLAALAIYMVNDALKRLPMHRVNHRLDLVGAALIVTATVALLLALTWGGARYPWGSPQILGLLAFSAALWVVLPFHLHRQSEPLVPLEIMRNPVVASATWGVFFAMGVNVGLSVYIPVYLESVMGMGADVAGLILVAFLAGTVTGANFTGRRMMRDPHYKRFALGGLVLSICSMALLGIFSGSLSLPALVVLLLTAGLGAGTMFPVTTVSVQNAVEPHHLGVATATLNFLRSLGSAMGVAVLGAILLANGADPGAHGAAGSDALRDTTAHAFSLVFAAATLALMLAFACISMMEERTLRGAVPHTAVEG